MRRRHPAGVPGRARQVLQELYGGDGDDCGCMLERKVGHIR